MRHSMILALVAVLVCGISADSKEKSVKYISKYSTSKNPAVIECVFDEKTNQFITRRGDVTTEVSQYRSRNDFMAERRDLGRSYLVSKKIQGRGYEDECSMSYDEQGRLIREEGKLLTIEWIEWDEAKRNTVGRFIFKGSDIVFNVSVSYDDKTNTDTLRLSVPDSVRDKSGKLPEIMIITYDEFRNEIARKSIMFNGETDVETKTVIEYKEIE